MQNVPMTMNLNSMREVARQYAESRQKMAQMLPGVPDAKLGAIAEILADIEVHDTTPPVSNLDRVGVARRAVATGERPALKHAIAAVLRDAGKALSADEVFEELKKRSWLPNAKQPRQYVGHALSTYKEMYVRDPEKGRGFYKLAEGAQIRLPEPPKPATPDVTEAQVEVAAATVAAEAIVDDKEKPAAEKSGLETPPKVKNAAQRIVKLLAKTREPFSITDIAKAAKIENHRQVTALVMTMLKKGAVIKLRKKNEAKNSLFEVQRAAFNKFVKGLS